MRESAKSIFNRLIFGGSLAYLILVTAVLAGGNSLWGNLQIYRQQVLIAQREATMVSSASVKFKMQVQEWKNILLRSEDPQNFVVLVGHFEKSALAVREQIILLKQQIKHPEQLEALAKFETKYQQLGLQYQLALASFQNSGFDHKKADAMVRGVDRPVTDMLDQIGRLADERAKTTERNAELALAESVYWVVGGLILGFAGSGIAFIILARRLVLLPTRQAFHDLQVATEQLRRSERMAALGGLVAGVAHEINTPVGISLTCATTLQQSTNAIQEKMREGPIKKQDLLTYLESARECSELMTSNACRAADLIQSFKQIAVDQTNEVRRHFGLYAYLQEVLASLHPQYKRTEIQVVVECPQDIMIDSYPGAFAQVITNLLMNSLHHAFEDGRSGQVIIAVEQRGEWIHLSFKDNGKGIPPENIRKIFDPFFTTRRNRGGTGLGLNIVYNIVTQTLGGNIDVESTVDTGTEFKIDLPKTLVVNQSLGTSTNPG